MHYNGMVLFQEIDKTVIDIAGLCGKMFITGICFALLVFHTNTKRITLIELYNIEFKT